MEPLDFEVQTVFESYALSQPSNLFEDLVQYIHIVWKNVSEDQDHKVGQQKSN